VLHMLDEIGSKDNVPAYIKKIKEGKGRLMGFGHRVYKNYDPRAKVIKRAADRVFEVTGPNAKLEIALELERIALEDDYFVQRKLYPNVDFYSGIMYQAMGFKPEMFTVLFAIPRAIGWLSQWQEMLTDPEQKIARPRQVWIGHETREFVPMEKRGAGATARQIIVEGAFIATTLALAPAGMPASPVLVRRAFPVTPDDRAESAPWPILGQTGSSQVP